MPDSAQNISADGQKTGEMYADFVLFAAELLRISYDKDCDGGKPRAQKIDVACPSAHPFDFQGVHLTVRLRKELRELGMREVRPVLGSALAA